MGNPKTIVQTMYKGRVFAYLFSHIKPNDHVAGFQKKTPTVQDLLIRPINTFHSKKSHNSY